jgi:NADH-quinone oxidoreductase subunit G
VCDKGGECPLQDQAFSHGPGESRFIEEKRHFEKPIPISDLVYLDRERCILCDRCTRFADEVAGDPLIRFTHRGNETQVLTFPDEPFASYFSGNTVQICPVGALTAKPYRFKARPWDLEQLESTCTTCSVGCRVVIQASRNEIVRYNGVDSDPVNWGWLCDKGRFSYEATNSPERIQGPYVRQAADGSLGGTADEFVPAEWSDALDATATAIEEALADGGPSSVALIGGARGTNEDAFAWARLAREVIGTANTDAQLGDGLDPAVFGLPQATIDETCAASTIVLLGPDLKEELPVLYLRVRDAAEKRRSRLLELAPRQTGLTRYAWRSTAYLAGEQADVVRSLLAEREVADQLAAGPVVVIVGRANLAETTDAPTLAALSEILRAAPGAKVLPALRRGNVRGAIAAGLTPGEGGLDTNQILRAAAEGRIGCLLLLGADPVMDCPDAGLARRAMAGARHVIAIDDFFNASSRLAHVLLAAATAGEKRGTTTNLEGRVSTVAQEITAAGTTRPDWMIAAELAARLGGDLGVTTLDDVASQLTTTVPAFAPCTADALRAAPDGVLLERVESGSALPPPRSETPARSGYDFRLVVSRTLYDAGVVAQMSPSLAPLAPGATLHLHPLDLERLGAEAGTPLQISTTRTSVVLDVEPDPAVPRGAAWVPFNQPGSAVSDLIDSDAAVVDVRVENL